MGENKICPNCKTENKSLDLIETQGIYICSNCKKLIDANTNKVIADDSSEILDNKKSIDKR